MDTSEYPEVQAQATNGHSHQEPNSNSGAISNGLVFPRQPIVFKRNAFVKKEQNTFQTLSDQQLFDFTPLTEKPKINDVFAYRVTNFHSSNLTGNLSSFIYFRCFLWEKTTLLNCQAG